TAPMFIGYTIVFNYNPSLSLNTILTSVLAAALFEELYFRAFLFGQLFRYTQLGFIPSATIGALLFGLVHLYQGNNLGESAGVFAVTFAGGMLYAWVFVEKEFNIWIPVFLHLFMNLSWGLFDVSGNAMGGIYANIFRAFTIALIIILTIKENKRYGKELVINRKSLWYKTS
ncbi:MAG: CPBP family intramembrane metalloprotease, partial [Saprospiraceae bacterium]|nr:CPBP family intramembrane metalloprotease [Saprospiraceae bacterium]